MANAIGIINLCSTSSACVKFKNFRTKTSRVCYVSASTNTVSDPYKTLRIRHDASKSEVKKDFRQLALRILMSQLREKSTKTLADTYEFYDEVIEEAEIEMNGPDLDLWEEWMGWEGAGIRDYSSHINPYL